MRSINREILRLSIPNILSNIVIPLAGMVDIAIMGHLGSGIYIGAIALGATIFNFIYWGFGFLRMSTTGFTAQAFGAGDSEGEIAVFTRAGIIAIGVALMLILLQKPIGWLAFELIRGPADVEAEAMRYFSVRIYAAPATLLLYVFFGWFTGMQNSIIPSAVAIIISLVNGAASYILVFYRGMGADGVALGTVIAQYTGLLLAIFFFRIRYFHRMQIPGFRTIFKSTDLRSFMRVNRDIFIRTLCLIAVMTFFTARSAVYGTELLAVNTMLFQFFIFFSYFIDGFAYAGEALTGRFTGSREPDSLRRMLKSLFSWGIGLSLVFTILYLLFGQMLPFLLTTDKTVIAASKPYIVWTILIPVAAFAAFLWDGVFIGATAGREMRNVMLVSAIIFFGAYFIMSIYIGNHALWLAMLVFLAARSAGMTVFSKGVFVNLRQAS